MASTRVTDAKIYRNLSFCLRDFHSFFKVISQICISNSEHTVARSATSIMWKNDWLKSGVALIRTISTEQWINGLIDCANVSVRKEDTLNISYKQLDCFDWHQLHLKTLGVRQRYLKFDMSAKTRSISVIVKLYRNSVDIVYILGFRIIRKL